jgi:hypothetical protein
MSFRKVIFGTIWLTFLLHTLPEIKAQNLMSEAHFGSANSVVMPEDCVTLREGRDCFATITINWSVSGNSDYCLRRQYDGFLIGCWENTSQAELIYEFQSESQQVLQLISKKSQVVLASATINVSWVHKSKRRKLRRRLFKVYR